MGNIVTSNICARCGGKLYILQEHHYQERIELQSNGCVDFEKRTIVKCYDDDSYLGLCCEKCGKVAEGLYDKEGCRFEEW